MILIPNVLTACNLLLGLAALALGSGGEILSAWWCILAAVFFDGMDGRTARWLRRESTFGRIFDSCADFVSFGCAPAFCSYLLEKDLFPFWATASAWVYLSCAGWRLARFHRLGGHGRTFVGLPTTASAFLYASTAIGLGSWGPAPLIHAAVLPVLSVLMVSRLPVPSFAPAH